MDWSDLEILKPNSVDPINDEPSTGALAKFKGGEKLCSSSVVKWTRLPNEIWAKVFGHLLPEDILNLRLVCRVWSNLITAVWAHRFSMRIKGIDRIIQILNRGIQSRFCRRVEFHFIVSSGYIRGAQGWVDLKRFCIEFGPQITVLSIGHEYEMTFFLFSPQVRKHLSNIKKLRMTILYIEGLIPTSFSFLSNLEYIEIGDTFGSRASLRGDIKRFALSKNLLTFVIRILESGHHLKGMEYLSRLNHTSSLIPALFKNGGNNLETLRIGELETTLLKFVASSALRETWFRLLDSFGDHDHDALYNFLCSHSRTLERMTVYSVKCCGHNTWRRPTLTSFPRMDALVYLKLELAYVGWTRYPEYTIISSLGFTTQLPNLEVLDVGYSGGNEIMVPSHDKIFQHQGLRKLITSFGDRTHHEAPGYITSFLNQVPFCFPHLTKLELSRFNGLPRTIGRLTFREVAGLSAGYGHNTWEAD